MNGGELVRFSIWEEWFDGAMMGERKGAFGIDRFGAFLRQMFVHLPNSANELFKIPFACIRFQLWCIGKMQVSGSWPRDAN